MLSAIIKSLVISFMKKISFGALGLLTPFLAFAQFDTGGYVTSAFDLVKTIVTGYLFPILASLAILYFIWELIQYIKSTPEKKAENRSSLLYSILALFIIFSIMGIIRVLQNVTDTGGNQQINTSQIPGINF
jgi:hypothetical protein